MNSHAVVLVALIAGLCLPASAHAASVTVQGDTGPGRSLDLAALPQDVERPYLVRTAAGEGQVQVRGTSLNSLLAAADADLIGVGSIEISGGGRTVVLAPDQLSGRGAGSPVVYADGARAAFLRPAYSSDDLNGDQRLTGATLRIRTLKRKTLEVEGRVSDAAVRVGQRVTFTASGRGGAGQELRYRWTFDDGSIRQSGARVTHRFREEGSYNVLVGLTTSQNPAGPSDIVRVRVGPAPKGPTRAGGGSDDDVAAPSSGTAAGGTGGTSGGTGAAAGGPARAPEAAPARPRRSRPAPNRGGREVQGTLLAGATTVPPRPAARKRAARTGNDAPGGGGSRVPGVAWGVLVTLGLAGTGALIELRTILPLPRPRRTA